MTPGMRVPRIVRRASGCWGGLGAILVLVLFAMPLAGQDDRSGRRGDRSPEERAELEQRIRAQMARVMQERLELTDETAERLSAVVQQFVGRRRDLGRAERATRRRVEALMLEGGENDAEARQLLERMIDLRRQEGALFEEEQAALLEVLSPVKVLELQSLREQMGRRIRSLRGNDDERGRRRGPGGEGVKGGGRDGSYGPGRTGQSRHGSGNVDGVHGVPLSL